MKTNKENTKILIIGGKEIKVPKKPIVRNSSISVNNAGEGKLIEHRVAKLVKENEPIKDGAQLYYQERKEGVNPAYNPRTDKMAIARQAMSIGTQAVDAQREEFYKPKEVEETTEKVDKPAE